MTKKLTIEIKGKTDGDLEVALEEVVSKVQQGFLSGSDRNETGSYHFDISEE